MAPPFIACTDIGTCDEDDWEFPVRRGELALKIKTALPRQPHVEDQAGGAIRRLRLEKVGNGREKLGFQADSDRKRRPTEARRSGSSSMTRTVGFASGIAAAHGKRITESSLYFGRKSAWLYGS